ncbi:hypothetical protein [Comamonas sp.]
MNPQSFAIAFFTIGELEGLSGEEVARTAHIDVPAECLPVAATLQSARQWLNEQHAEIDMECAAELPVRAYFSFKSEQVNEGFNVESAQLVALDEGFVVRAALDNGVCVESDLFTLHL